MNYREEQRQKVIEIRQSLFHDPGKGIFLGKERDFVLENPSLNLWAGIRYDAVNYFEENNIVWWNGKDKQPSGHLLSSQIACINHLYFLRQRRDVATAILQSIDPEITEACIVDDGFVEFEFIGERQYLNEKGFTRGANCTSVDGVLMGKTNSGELRFFFIEWKYTEDYAQENKYIPERGKVYDELIQSIDSPFISSIEVESLYYEPFYQLMRQTLLAEECVKNRDHGVTSYKHIHVVPEDNLSLKENITSPQLSGKDIHEVWKGLLKDESTFIHLSPEQLLEPVVELVDTISILRYLEERYWQ